MRKEAAIQSPVSGKLLELDIWIQEHQISFEFQVRSIENNIFSNYIQDHYHYITSRVSHLPLPNVAYKDNIFIVVFE